MNLLELSLMLVDQTYAMRFNGTPAGFDPLIFGCVRARDIPVDFHIEHAWRPSEDGRLSNVPW